MNYIPLSWYNIPCSIDTCPSPEQLGCFQISSCANSTVMNNFICILIPLHYAGWNPAIKMTGSKGYEDLTDFHFWGILDIWFLKMLILYRVWFNTHPTEWDSSYFITVFCKLIFLFLHLQNREKCIPLWTVSPFVFCFAIRGRDSFQITQHWNLRLISMVDWIWGWRNERNKKIM